MIVVVRVRTLLQIFTVDGPELLALDDTGPLVMLDVLVGVDWGVVLDFKLETTEDALEELFGPADVPVVVLVAAELDGEGEAPVT